MAFKYLGIELNKQKQQQKRDKKRTRNTNSVEMQVLRSIEGLTFRDRQISAYENSAIYRTSTNGQKREEKLELKSRHNEARYIGKYIQKTTYHVVENHLEDPSQKGITYKSFWLF